MRVLEQDGGLVCGDCSLLGEEGIVAPSVGKRVGQAHWWLWWTCRRCEAATPSAPVPSTWVERILDA